MVYELCMSKNNLDSFTRAHDVRKNGSHCRSRGCGRGQHWWRSPLFCQLLCLYIRVIVPLSLRLRSVTSEYPCPHRLSWASRGRNSGGLNTVGKTGGPLTERRIEGCKHNWLNNKSSLAGLGLANRSKSPKRPCHRSSGLCGRWVSRATVQLTTGRLLQNLVGWGRATGMSVIRNREFGRVACTWRTQSGWENLPEDLGQTVFANNWCSLSKVC